MNAEPSNSGASFRVCMVDSVGIAAIFGVIMAAFFALRYSILANWAASQPGHDDGFYVAMVWLFVPLGLLCAAVVVACLGRRQFVRSVMCAVLLVVSALPIGYLLAVFTMPKLKDASLRIAGSMRFVWIARQNAEAEGVEHAATLLLLLVDGQYISQRILIDAVFINPSTPRTPDPAVFNYNGITMDDVYQQRVTRQEIIDAANAVLGDEPWERIGWTWYLRDGRPYQPGTDPAIIVGGGIIHSRIMSTLLLHADGRVRLWRSDDPGLAGTVTAAIAAAESAGVAPPPQELIDLVHALRTTR